MRNLQRICLASMLFNVSRSRKKWLWAFAALPVLLLAAFLGVFVVEGHYRHQHCIKNTGLALRIYATDHDGRYPYHTDGFGDALVLLVKENAAEVRHITGPGDDGEVFRNALKTGAHVPENRCSRIYVQGLSESSNHDVAVIFDKKPTPGGDHYRRPWGPLLREICMVDGSMQIVLEENWAPFVTNQIELLVQEGIDRKTAEHYYNIP